MGYFNKREFWLILVLFVTATENQHCSDRIFKNNCGPGTVNETQLITVRLDETNSNYSDYAWGVNYKIVNQTCKNIQRCTLLTWDTVRKLEKFLTLTFRTQKKDIVIDRSLLLPGVEYYTNLTLRDAQRNIIKNVFQILKLDNVDAVNNKESTGFITLFGSNATFVDLPYYISAEVVLCADFDNFFIAWELLDDSQNVIKTFPTKGQKLELPPYTLSVKNTLAIRSKLFDVKNNSVLSEAVKWVNTLEHGLMMKISAIGLTTGVGNPIKLNLNVTDPDKSNSDYKVQWFCNYEEANCTNFDSNNSTMLDLKSGLKDTGNYTITAEVTTSNKVYKLNCEIEVREKILPLIEIDASKTVVNYSSNEISIHAHVRRLTAGCFMQWTCVIGCESFNFSDIFGNLDEVTPVSLREDLFLQELDEYTNDTVDQDYNLFVSAIQGIFTENLEELNGTAQEKAFVFRLNVTCPVNIFDYEEMNETEAELLYRFDPQTALADVEIKTYPNPAITELFVEPKDGVAHETIFCMSIETADETQDLVYKFGYSVKNDTILFQELSGVREILSTLPFSDDGLVTVAEACNFVGACKRVMGPLINVRLPRDTADKRSKYAQDLAGLMFREEYQYALSFTTNILNMYKHMPNESYQDIHSKFTSTIKSEVQKSENMDMDLDKKVLLDNMLDLLKIRRNVVENTEPTVGVKLLNRTEENPTNFGDTVDIDIRKLVSRKLLSPWWFFDENQKYDAKALTKTKRIYNNTTEQAYFDALYSDFVYVPNNTIFNSTNETNENKIQPISDAMVFMLIIVAIGGLMLVIFITKKLILETEEEDQVDEDDLLKFAVEESAHFSPDGTSI